MEKEFEYKGQPLTKEEVIEMFRVPEFNMEVIFSDEPPLEVERWGNPMSLPNYTIYMCSDWVTKEPFDSKTEDDATYWVVAVENKNPIVEFSTAYIDHNIRDTEDINDMYIRELNEFGFVEDSVPIVS